VNDAPEPAGTLDPERFDRWFERPWGRHAFAVERDALLHTLGPLHDRRLLEVGCGTGRFTAAFEAAGAVRVTRPGGRIAVATLNPNSPWGLAHRRELRHPPWSGACLRTRRQLRALLARHGRPRVHAALYAPGMLPGFSRLARVVERAGRWAPAIGAFQVAVLDLPDPARGSRAAP
jgi:hypothetical protein